MKRTRAAVLGAWLCLAVPAAEARAQGASPAGEKAPVIERIEVLNNQYLQRETLLFYISTKPGDVYDERKLREDFKRLWDTGFLDDLPNRCHQRLGADTIHGVVPGFGDDQNGAPGLALGNVAGDKAQAF